MQFLHQRLLEDYTKLLNYAQTNLHQLKMILDTWKELPFHTNRVVSKHNARDPGHENSSTFKKVPVVSEKVMVCCEMHKSKIISSYFFSNQPEMVKTRKACFATMLCPRLPRILDFSGYFFLSKIILLQIGLSCLMVLLYKTSAALD